MSGLTLALPKGRVLERSVELLKSAGLRVDVSSGDRRLRHEGGDALVIEMRNVDVPTYVELGVADAGIVGKDVLVEAGSKLFEPVDLRFAACRLSLIRPGGETHRIRRVASKHPRTSAEYPRRPGRNAEGRTPPGPRRPA